MPPMATNPLTDNQTALAAAYAIQPDVQAAAKRAGITAPTARRALSDARLQDAISILRAHSKTGLTESLTRDYVVAQLMEILERSMQRAPVLKGRGNMKYQAKDVHGAPIWTYDAASALRAAELLGKVLGMWNDKLEVEHTLSDAAQRWLGRAGDDAKVIEGKSVEVDPASLL